MTKEEIMNDPTYKYIEVVGTSSEGTDEAVRNAIKKASKTLKHMDWFFIHDTRGLVENGKVSSWQVTIKIGFKIED